MSIEATVDWRIDLGGGVHVALIQAGVFKSDAGTVFGPVPRAFWERLVTDEMDPDSTLDPGPQLPAGGDAGGASAGRDGHR